VKDTATYWRDSRLRNTTRNLPQNTHRASTSYKQQKTSGQSNL